LRGRRLRLAIAVLGLQVLVGLSVGSSETLATFFFVSDCGIFCGRHGPCKPSNGNRESAFAHLCVFMQAGQDMRADVEGEIDRGQWFGVKVADNEGHSHALEKGRHNAGGDRKGSGNSLNFFHDNSRPLTWAEEVRKDEVGDGEKEALKH
jgi:hypothetical protein